MAAVGSTPLIVTKRSNVFQNRGGGGKKSSRSGMPNQNQDDGWTNVQPPKARSSVTERIDHNKIANLAQRSGRGVSPFEGLSKF